MHPDHLSNLIHTFLIVDNSDIVKLGSILLDKSLMGRIVGHIIVTILFRRELDDEAVRESALDLDHNQ